MVVELIERVFSLREMESQRLNLNVFESGIGNDVDVTVTYRVVWTSLLHAELYCYIQTSLLHTCRVM